MSIFTLSVWSFRRNSSHKTLFYTCNMIYDSSPSLFQPFTHSFYFLLRLLLFRNSSSLSYAYSKTYTIQESLYPYTAHHTQRNTRTPTHANTHTHTHTHTHTDLLKIQEHKLVLTVASYMYIILQIKIFFYSSLTHSSLSSIKNRKLLLYYTAMKLQPFWILLLLIVMFI